MDKKGRWTQKEAGSSVEHLFRLLRSFTSLSFSFLMSNRGSPIVLFNGAHVSTIMAPEQYPGVQPYDG